MKMVQALWRSFVFTQAVLSDTVADRKCNGVTPE